METTLLMILENFSWTEYFISLAVVGAIYYLLIALIYYRAEMKAVLNPKSRRIPMQPMAVSPDEREETDPVVDLSNVKGQDEEHVDVESTDNSFWKVEALIKELKAVIGTAAEKRTGKEKLLPVLKGLLGRYQELNNLAFREPVNEFISTTCRELGAVPLTEDEVDELWGNSG